LEWVSQTDLTTIFKKWGGGCLVQADQIVMAIQLSPVCS